MDDDKLPFHPWGTVDPGFWAGAQTEEVSDPRPAPAPSTSKAPPQSAAPDLVVATISAEVAAQLAVIQSAAASDLARANTLAEELDAKTTAARGEAHIETVRVREVRAYLVHLTGFHETAVAWYLHIVRLHAALHGPDHDETTLAVRRAYSMWRSLPTPHAKPLAGDLVKVFTEVQGADATAVRRVQVRLQEQADADRQRTPSGSQLERGVGPASSSSRPR
ncbi:hypothetical protein ACFV30_41850 [Streptomyces sp. NPDC059752]|uniref:hypothetical protein n=1 Tax=unclassified Streptomyces TaxID=2593676 RepID=UPI0036477155